MKILFIHQNMPAQFVHLIRYLSSMHTIVFISCDNGYEMNGVEKRIVVHSKRDSSSIHRYLRSVEPMIYNGQATWRVCNQLKLDGFIPDIIYGHPGWGDMLFVADAYPNVPIINYCEFYYRGLGADVHFNTELIDPDLLAKVRIKNTHLLSSLESCDVGISPTNWQRSLHPKEFHPKIQVCHDGINTHKVCPDSSASVTISNQLTLDSTMPIITYVARNLEPYRGFPNAMRAIETTLHAIPNAHAIILGGDDVSYGSTSPSGLSYREELINDLNLPLDRIHFLGVLPFDQYLSVLRVSSVHLYLTVPFVLSWSCLEAMAAQCLVVGSNTAPVSEVIQSGRNGFLVDFADIDGISKQLTSCLLHQDDYYSLRVAARETVIDQFNLERCLASQVNLLQSVLYSKEVIYA